MTRAAEPEGKQGAVLRQHGAAPFRIALVHGGPGAAGELWPVARRLGSSRGVLESMQPATTLDRQVEELRGVAEAHADAPVSAHWAFVGCLAENNKRARLSRTFSHERPVTPFASQEAVGRVRRLRTGEKTSEIGASNNPTAAMSSAVRVPRASPNTPPSNAPAGTTPIRKKYMLASARPRIASGGHPCRILPAPTNSKG